MAMLKKRLLARSFAKRYLGTEDAIPTPAAPMAAVFINALLLDFMCPFLVFVRQIFKLKIWHLASFCKRFRAELAEKKSVFSFTLLTLREILFPRPTLQTCNENCTCIRTSVERRDIAIFPIHSTAKKTSRNIHVITRNKNAICNATCCQNNRDTIFPIFCCVGVVCFFPISCNVYVASGNKNRSCNT